jgi:hypothetical protein
MKCIGGDLMKTTEAQARATKKYQKANTRMFTLRLNLNTDMDIINKLEQVENKQGYIKQLIRTDIAGH